MMWKSSGLWAKVRDATDIRLLLSHWRVVPHSGDDVGGDEENQDGERCDRVTQTCDHAVGASHTQMTASAAMMAITTAMKVSDLYT